MRQLGLLGGMSWESTAVYYRLLNEGVKARRGGLHSAPLLLWSVDFAPMAEQQAAGDWAGMAAQLGEAGRRLVKAGAGALLICTNTMHRLYDEIAAAAGAPVLHIADAAGQALLAQGRRHPALLGTRFTMEGDFYRQRLAEQFGLEALIPEPAGRERVHRIIYDELCQGQVSAASKAVYLEEIAALKRAGADSLLLGCTEIGLLIGQDDTDLPVFDTASLHAQSGVDWLLGT